MLSAPTSRRDGDGKPLASERWQDDSEDRTAAAPFEQELALMLTYDAVGHKQT